MNFNKFIAVGRIANDAERKDFDPESSVTSNSFVTSESWKDKNGEWQEKAHFLNIKAWNKTGDRLGQIQKGALVLIEGKLEVEKWTTSEGANRSKVVINVQSIKRLEKRADIEFKTPKNDVKILIPDGSPDDLPF